MQGVQEKLFFFLTFYCNQSFANISLLEISKVISAMRVYNHSYWLGHFLNDYPVLARERCQNTEENNFLNTLGHLALQFASLSIILQRPLGISSKRIMYTTYKLCRGPDDEWSKAGVTLTTVIGVVPGQVDKLKQDPVIRDQAAGTVHGCIWCIWRFAVQCVLFLNHLHHIPCLMTTERDL